MIKTLCIVPVQLVLNSMILTITIIHHNSEACLFVIDESESNEMWDGSFLGEKYLKSKTAWRRGDMMPQAVQ